MAIQRPSTKGSKKPKSKLDNAQSTMSSWLIKGAVTQVALPLGSAQIPAGLTEATAAAQAAVAKKRIEQNTTGETVKPQSKPKLKRLTVLQLNVNGLAPKALELTKLLHENQVDIALLQETMLRDRKVVIKGYTMYHCTCQGCQGLATLISNSLTARPLTAQCSTGRTDTLTAEVCVDERKIVCINIYNPPKHDISLSVDPPILSNTIIGGDFNAHSPAWGYTMYDMSGRKVEELCNTTNLFRLQDANSPPTLLHRGNGTLSRPDLTLVSGDLFPITTFKVLDDVGSDHNQQ